MKTTIFNTPIITPAFRGLFRLSLRLLGWRVVGQLPDIPKFVIAGAPHTSNWDFVMFLATGLHPERRPALHGQKGIVPLALRRFLPLVRRRGCGPFQTAGSGRANGAGDSGSRPFSIDHHPRRDAQQGGQMEVGFLSHRQTSRRFPISTGFVDSVTKTCGIGPTFTLTDDMEADINDHAGLFQR